MKELNFIQTAQEAANRGVVMVDTTFAEKVKSSLHHDSREVELTIKNNDNMLGVKLNIYNHIFNFPLQIEMGIDTDGLDAILMAMGGQMDALKAYDPANRPVEKGKGLKLEILNQFLKTSIPCNANIRNVENGKLIEVYFLLGFQRKVKLYFNSNDAQAFNRLVEVGLIEI